MKKALKYCIFTGIVLLISSISIPVFGASTITVLSDIEYDVYVDDDADPSWYNETHVRTIQEAIDNASEENFIFVFNGTYVENIIVNKTVFFCRDPSVIVDGMGGVGFNVSANNTAIHGFTIINCSIGVFVYNKDYMLDSVKVTNTIIHDSGHGIILQNTNRCLIFDNIIFNNTGNSLFLTDSSNATINMNDFYNNSQNGITLKNAYNCHVSFNKIHNNSDIGISIIDNSEYNTIDGNEIINNSDIGIYIAVSSNNTLHNNNFIDNTQNAVDTSNNTWYHIYFENEGNYWDDYTGLDEDYNGIGDTQYNISGGENIDPYPLMRPHGQGIALNLTSKIQIISFKQVVVTVENTDDETIVIGDLNVTVTGGLIGRVNLSNNKTLENFEPTNTTKITSGPDELKGFGTVSIVVIVRYQGDIVYKETHSGFVIGKLFIDDSLLNL